MLTIELYHPTRLQWLHRYRLCFTLKSWANSVWVGCQAFTWSKPLTCDIQSSKSVWMDSFEIYGKSSFQTNIPTNQHVRNAATVSMGLAQARSNYTMYTCIGSQTWPYKEYTWKPWVGGGRAGPPTWVTVTHLAAYSFKNNVQSNTKSVQLTDCLNRLKV